MNATNDISFQQNAVQERLILEAAKDYAIFTTDLQRRITSWNAGAEAMFGYTETDIVGQSGDLLYVPEDQEQANGGHPGAPQREAEKALREGRAENERWHLHQNGSRIYGSGVVTPLRDEVGTTIGLVKIMRDLTRQKQAEEALSQSEDRFRAFVTATSDAVYRMSADWHQVHQLMGKSFLPDTSATGSPATRASWLEQYIPLPDQAQVQDYIEKAIQARKPFELAHRVIKADGGLGWTFSSAIPILNQQGEITEWFGTARDITDHKRAEEALVKSEEKYRRLFETMDTGFAVGEAIRDERGKMVNYRLIQLNPAFEKLTGLNFSEAVGKTILELLPGIDPWWLDTYQQVVDSGETVHVEEFLAPLDRWYDVTAFYYGEEQFAAYYNDITDRKRHEANLIFLAETSADFAPLTSAEAIMQHVAGRLAEHLQLSRCLFAVVDEDADRIEVIYDWKRDGTMPPLLGVHRISDNLTDIGRKQYSAGKLFVMNATQENPIMNAPVDVLKAIGFGSLVDVPHRLNGRWTFLLTIGRSQASEWRDDELELIQELAARIYIRIERARTEEALRQSEEKYRWLFETMDLGFALHEVIRDENGQLINYRLLQLNPAFEKLTGIDISKAVGKTILEVLPGHDPWWFTTFQQLLESKETIHIEQFLPQVNRWYNITAFYYREEQFAAYYSDVTERKRHETNLAFLAEVSRDLVHLTTIDETMDALGAKIGRHFTATHCAFFEFNEAMDSAVCNYDWREVNEPSFVGSYRTSDFYTDEFLQIMRAGEAFVVTDREADSRADATNLAALNIASCIVIPIVTGRELLFVLSINDSQTRDWRDDEIELLRELTSRIWTRLERARADESLRESEKRFRLAIEATELGTWEWDLETDEVYLNEQYFRLFGIEPGGSGRPGSGRPGSGRPGSGRPGSGRPGSGRPGNPIGSGALFSHIHPDDRERVTVLLRQAIADRSNYNTEFCALLDDGSQRWMSSYGRVVEERDGKPVRMSGVMFDITERRENEQSLRRSDERFRTLVQNLPDYAIFRIDSDAIITEWTEGAQRVKGYTAEEAVGQHLSLFYTPENLAAGELTNEIKEATRHGRAERESIRIRKGGQRFWVDEIMTAIRDEAGRLVGFTKISRDITQRKRADEALFDSRQRLQIVLDSIADHAIITADPRNRIVSWNPGARQMFGYTADEAIGQSAAIIFTPEDQATGQPEKEMDMARRQGRAPDERYHLRKDGSRLYVSGTQAPLYDADKTLVGYVKVARDLTDRRRMEQTLREADQRKDEFLALLAHELRNPLATLSNTLLILDLTGGQTDDMSIPTATAMMNREVAQLTRLVDDLLDVSRISRGKLTLTFERLDLTALVGQALEAVRAQFESANRRLSATLPQEPLYLNGDAVRLRQVVSNLLTNALKFTFDGGHVGVTLERADRELVLRVQDDGNGIPPHELTRIFEMFAQVDSSLSRSQGGLGLGLTLVHELVNLHGGRVAAYSAGDGQGSTFTIQLPLDTSIQIDMENIPTTQPAPGAKRRVLVVDDNQDAATTLSMLLKLLGNDVHTRFDGGAGVEAADSLRPQVAILDISMPVMDGYQAAQRIREQPWGQHMVLIALSGYGQEEDKRRSREAGFDTHLVKPVDITALKELLASLPS